MGRAISVDFAISERGLYERRFNEIEEGGKIGIIRSGMDCDCVQYRDEYVVDRPRNLFAWLRDEHEHENWLDGPETTYFCRPSECRDGYHNSVDRVLEAYEDGHRHVVYWGDMG